jgi:hypothetical protein
MAKKRTPNFDRLDDVDVYIQSVPRTPEEEERLHELLRAHMRKTAGRKPISSVAKKTKQRVASR